MRKSTPTPQAHKPDDFVLWAPAHPVRRKLFALRTVALIFQSPAGAVQGHASASVQGERVPERGQCFLLQLKTRYTLRMEKYDCDKKPTLHFPLQGGGVRAALAG